MTAHFVDTRVVLTILAPESRDELAPAICVGLVPDCGVALDELIKVAHDTAEGFLAGVLRESDSSRDCLRGPQPSTTFRPMMPIRISARNPNRAGAALSPSATIPTAATPTAPIPTQIA
jgi:hypothetical protein